jgi:hypothetical protein
MVGKNEEAALISGGFFDAQLSAKAVNIALVQLSGILMPKIIHRG